MAVKLTALDVMRDAPVIPVIVLEDVKHAVPLARALVAGGIRMLEVTLRTPAALACIEAISNSVPEAVPGAGTVRNTEELHAAKWAGARFAVSPGYSAAIGRAAQDFSLPLLPGVVTPGEVMAALADGYEQLKFFPAVPSGGIEMLKALHGPFADVKFCPTGGVNPQNAKDFLALPNVVCVGGSWLTPADAIAQGDWGRITQLAREARTLLS